MALDDKTLQSGFAITGMLRKAGIAADQYPDAAKLKKQMKYADARGVAYVGILGFEELASDQVMLKDMRTGEQRPVDIDTLIEILK